MQRNWRRATVATVLEPGMRGRLDAAAHGYFAPLHTDSLPDALRAVRERPVHAVLVSPRAVRREHLASIGTLITRFPGVPTVAVLATADASAGAAGSISRPDESEAAGRVRDLLEHGYDVSATDIVARFGEDDVLRAALTDYGQAVEALAGADGVVHLDNIPAPGLATPAVTFNANMTMNFNVFHAAANLKLSRVVWASSETTLGLPFDFEGVPRSRVDLIEDGVFRSGVYDLRPAKQAGPATTGHPLPPPPNPSAPSRRR